MRPPYLVCARYCPHFDRCAPILALFTEAELAGRPHPMSMALVDGCPMRGMPVRTERNTDDLGHRVAVPATLQYGTVTYDLSAVPVGAVVS